MSQILEAEENARDTKYGSDTVESSSSGLPSFSDPDIEEKLFGRDAPEIDIPYWHSSGAAAGRSPVTKKRKVLSAEEEACLFLRYDYARYRLKALDMQSFPSLHLRYTT